MTTNHTPGEWTIRHDAPDPAHHGGVIRNLVCVEGRGPVAEVCAPAGRDWPARCDANARLIAAAPDLLAAVEAVEAHWAAGNFSREEWLWGQMRAALAKAARP